MRSLGIVAVTSVFIGMVMTIQFAFGLQRFGGIEYIPRVIVLSFLRELGPTLTAVIVGGRIGSGMAAEVGAMNVTEQVDAIRALGGDPAKKLVLPRVAGGDDRHAAPQHVRRRARHAGAPCSSAQRVRHPPDALPAVVARERAA